MNFEIGVGGENVVIPVIKWVLLKRCTKTEREEPIKMRIFYPYIWAMKRVLLKRSSDKVGMLSR